MLAFSLGCGELPLVDFAATGPSDAYFIVEASARWHVEHPGLVYDLLVVERHGESFSVTQAPFDAGRCKIRAVEDELFLLCTNSSEKHAVKELRFARRTGGEWRTQVLGPATPDTLLLGFEVAPNGRVFAATGESTTGARTLFVAEEGGDFEAETLQPIASLETAVMTLDRAGEPVWAAWTHRDTFRLSYTGGDGTEVELASRGIDGVPLQLAPFADENDPLILTLSEEGNSAYLPGDEGFTRVTLTPPTTETYDCPRDETDCTGVDDRTCTLEFENFWPPIAATSATHGTFIVYLHDVGSSVTHQFDCQANCSCSSTSDYDSSSEVVFARLESSGEPSVLERLPSLPRPVAMAVTGDTAHVLAGDGNAYFTLIAAEP